MDCVVVGGVGLSPLVTSYVVEGLPMPGRLLWAEVLSWLPPGERIAATRRALKWARQMSHELGKIAKEPDLTFIGWRSLAEWLDGALHADLTVVRSEMIVFALEVP